MPNLSNSQMLCSKIINEEKSQRTVLERKSIMKHLGEQLKSVIKKLFSD